MDSNLNRTVRGLPLWAWYGGAGVLGGAAFIAVRRWRAAKAAAAQQPGTTSTVGIPSDASAPLPGWSGLGGILGPLGGSSPQGRLIGYDQFGVPVYDPGINPPSTPAVPAAAVPPAPAPALTPAPHTTPTVVTQPTIQPPAPKPPTTPMPPTATTLLNAGVPAGLINAIVNAPQYNPMVQGGVIKPPALMPPATGVGQRYAYVDPSSGNTFTYTYG